MAVQERRDRAMSPARTYETKVSACAECPFSLFAFDRNADQSVWICKKLSNLPGYLMTMAILDSLQIWDDIDPRCPLPVLEEIKIEEKN